MTETTSGIPTEEKSRYETLKSELIKALPKKRMVDRSLAQIELQIYNLEASYLTETAAHSGGNIIQGFDGYLKNQTVGRRKYEVNENDRLFSRSSLTYQKVRIANLRHMQPTGLLITSPLISWVKAKTRPQQMRTSSSSPHLESRL
ncbi:NuA4-domain-containing protein [Tricholoma matsutake]|nr:NuA4-domain-containing protein [Tricholoma matsutake 945]